MTDRKARDFETEARDTIVRSTLAGVGVTVLAVVALSPAGFGGMIGTSIAAASGGHRSDERSDPFAGLPPFPTLLTTEEVSNIRGEITATAAAMEITRAATDDKIEFVRELAAHPDSLAVATVRNFIKSKDAPTHRDCQRAENAALAHDSVAPVATAAAGIASPSLASSAVGMTVAAAPIAPINFDTQTPDSHLEFASLMLGDN